MEDLENIHKGDSEQTLERISHNTGKTIGSLSSNLRRTSNQYQRKGKAYIDENPNKSLAISALAGAVLGSIVTLVARRQR